jgi:hypothetical protein
MIQLKNTKEQKEGERKEGVDLCVARETESISRLQQSLISHGLSSFPFKMLKGHSLMTSSSISKRGIRA